MTELSDFVEAIPRLQTATSFGAGFVVGAITRYLINRETWLPGGAVAAGVAVAAAHEGAMPNYATDIGAALVGDYIGSKLVDKLMRDYGKE